MDICIVTSVREGGLYSLSSGIESNFLAILIDPIKDPTSIYKFFHWKFTGED